MGDLVRMERTGDVTTSSEVIARGTETDHRAVIQLIRQNIDDLNEIGNCAFEMRNQKGAGRPTEYAVLNEPAATLLLTYMRNTVIVKDFKKRLVYAFYQMRKALLERPQTPSLTEDEIVQQALAITSRRVEELTIRVAELEKPAAAFEAFMDSKDTLSMKRAGEYLGYGPNQLYAKLREKRILRSDSEWNMPFADYDTHFHVIPVPRDNNPEKHDDKVFIWPASIDWVRSKIGQGPRRVPFYLKNLPAQRRHR